MACIPAMRRRTFRDHLYFPKSYGEYDDGSACPRSCRRAEKFCRNTQTCVPAGTPPRSLRRSLWRHGSARIAPMLLWALSSPGFLRAVPHHGERPSPHQETEAGTSARNTTRSYSDIAQDNLQKFCRLTPPANAGSSHRQTAWGGEVNTFVLTQPLRTLCTFQRAVSMALHNGELPPFRQPFSGKPFPTSPDVLILR